MLSGITLQDVDIMDITDKNCAHASEDVNWYPVDFDRFGAPAVFENRRIQKTSL